MYLESKRGKLSQFIYTFAVQIKTKMTVLSNKHDIQRVKLHFDKGASSLRAQNRPRRRLRKQKASRKLSYGKERSQNDSMTILILDYIDKENDTKQK